MTRPLVPLSSCHVAANFVKLANEEFSNPPARQKILNEAQEALHGVSARLMEKVTARKVLTS